MADKFATQITIGGTVTREVADRIRGLVSLELQGDWGENTVIIDTPEELLTFRNEQGHLWFCYDEQPNGEFNDLEAFLVENSIPFTRQHGPQFGYMGEVIEFRTGMEEPDMQYTDYDDRPQVDVEHVRDILEGMADLKKRGIKNRIEKFNFDHPTFDPLPKFEISG